MLTKLREIKSIIWGYVVEDDPIIKEQLHFYLKSDNLHKQVRKYLDDAQNNL